MLGVKQGRWTAPWPCTSLSLCHPFAFPARCSQFCRNYPGSLQLWSPQSEFRFSGQDGLEWPPSMAFWKRQAWKSNVSHPSSWWEHGACCNGFEPFSILSCQFLPPKSYYNKIPQLTAKALSFSVLVLQLWLSALLSVSVTPGTS